MNNDFINDVKKNDKPEVFVDADIKDNPALNSTLFEQMLNVNLETISDSYLYDVIKSSYKDILKGIIDRKDNKYLLTFTKPRFLTVLNAVLNSVAIEHDERLACNKLAYDYCTSHNPDEYIRNLMFIISKTVNRYYIPGLLGIGLSDNLASYLSLAGFSSRNNIVNVKRVNFIIMNQPSTLMTEQRIVDIYSKLFDFVTPVFEGAMFDYLDIDEDWVTDDIELVYSTISLAVLDVLHSIPTNDIIKVLELYSIDNQMLHADEPKRFSIRNIAEDYYKIISAIEFLDSKNIRVP